MTFRVILLLLAGGVILLMVVLAILDKLKITHIFMKGKPSGILGSSVRGLQDLLDQDAQKAHEYIVMEKEEKDKSEKPTTEKKPAPKTGNNF
jgi:hypothetical protein